MRAHLAVADVDHIAYLEQRHHLVTILTKSCQKAEILVRRKAAAITLPAALVLHILQFCHQPQLFRLHLIS